MIEYGFSKVDGATARAEDVTRTISVSDLLKGIVELTAEVGRLVEHVAALEKENAGLKMDLEALQDADGRSPSGLRQPLGQVQDPRCGTLRRRTGPGLKTYAPIEPPGLPLSYSL